MLNTRAHRIVGSDSSSHFKMTESPCNDSKARKLDAIQIEAERCQIKFHMRTSAPTAKEKRFSASYCHWQ